jgi:tryptophanyl-tRNA synthetase
LSELLANKIDPIGKKIKNLLKDDKYLDQILENGAQKADNLASKKINKIKDLIGF